MRRLRGTRSQHDYTPRGASGDVCESRNLPISTTLIQESAGRATSEVAHTAELSNLRSPGETCLTARPQIPVWPGGAGSSKGKKSSLSSATKYWSAREIQLRRSNRQWSRTKSACALRTRPPGAIGYTAGQVVKPFLWGPNPPLTGQKNVVWRRQFGRGGGVRL